MMDDDDPPPFQRCVIPAAPGWRAAFAFVFIPPEPGLDMHLWTQAIAAWSVERDGELVPIVVQDNKYLARADVDPYEAENSALIAVFGPDQATPNEEELRKLARRDYKIAGLLAQVAKQATEKAAG